MLVCTRLCSICELDITCSNGCKCTNNGWERVEVWLKCHWVIALKKQTRNAQSLVTHTSVTCKLWHERLNHGWFETCSPSTDTRLPQPCSVQPRRSKPIRELNLWAGSGHIIYESHTQKAANSFYIIYFWIEMDIVEITALCPKRPGLNSIEVRKEWQSCRIEARHWPTSLNGAPPSVRLSSQSAHQFGNKMTLPPKIIQLPHKGDEKNVILLRATLHYGQGPWS